MGSALAEGDIWIKFTVAYFGVFCVCGDQEIGTDD